MSTTSVKRAEPQPPPEEYLAPPQSVVLTEPGESPAAPEDVEPASSEAVLTSPLIAPLDDLVAPAPERTAPALRWIVGAILAMLGIGIVALLVLRSGGGTEAVTVDVAGIGTVEFTSIETTRTWEMQPGMTARPSNDSRTFIAVRADLGADMTEGVMDWAREAKVDSPDPSVMDGVADAFFIQVGKKVGEDSAGITWVFNVPTVADIDGLQMTLKDGEVVNLGDLPAYAG